MSRLGPTQHLVLRAMVRLSDRGDEANTASEIAQVMYGSMCRPTADGENVANTLRRLHTAGLVIRLGTSASGARCWAITDAGRAALTEASS